jgi:2-keto-myo-inositol isomerase
MKGQRAFLHSCISAFLHFRIPAFPAPLSLRYTRVPFREVSMLSRRALLLTPAALLALRSAQSVAEAAGGRMSLALHQNTSSRAGFRPSLEGWAKAGITQVEITSALLDQFLKTDSLAAAKRVCADLNLKPVCGACGVTGLIEPNPERAGAVDNFKKRCEQWAELGIPRIYSTTQTSIKPTADDYKAAVDNVREFGEIAGQFQLTAMFEFVRTSTFASTLTTLLSITRAAAQPNVGPLFDCYHFWSGLNKMEDLDTLRPGEVKHVHFQDMPDMPRELLDTTTRVIPGDGVTPLTTILQKLASRGYEGPLSVELFLPKYSAADPFEVAREIKTKAEAVMRQAKVV